jgi:hypothetical protein
VLKVGFGQDKQQLGYAIEVENPNAGAAIEGASLQLVAYGDGDTVLGTEDSTLPLIPPGATIYFGGSTFLDAEQPVQRIEAQITDQGERQEATADEIPPFSVEVITYRETSFSQGVSGVISNPFTVPLENLYVGVAAYNEAGEIIGGGFTFLDFLLPEGKSPFKASVTVSGTPARVEVSPILSNLTLWSQRDAEELPLLTLVEEGWGLNESQIGYGLVVENPDVEQAMDGAQYNIGVYAEDGSVLNVETGYFGLILPGTKVVRGSTIFLDSDGPAPVRVEMQILPGSLTDAEDKLAFTTEGGTYVPGQFGAKATGIILNPYADTAENVQVSVLLRDTAGKIIGGGSSFSDAIPGNGKAAIEVSVIANGEVAVAELYANEAAITSIGE